MTGGGRARAALLAAHGGDGGGGGGRGVDLQPMGGTVGLLWLIYLASLR